MTTETTRSALAAALASILALALPSGLRAEAATGASTPESARTVAGETAVSPEESRGLASLYNALGPASTSREAYESGVRAFESKRHGEALDLFQQAVDERRRRYGRAIELMDQVTGSKDPEVAKVVKRAGDSLTALVTGLAKRDLLDFELERIDAKAGASFRARASLLRREDLSPSLAYFLDAALAVLDLRPQSAVSDSLAALRAAALELEAFPEAEYRIGKVYEAEGETRLAQLQFERAYELRASLSIPDERYDMLYGLASLYEAGREMRSFETVLLEVVADDPAFAPARRYLREAMEGALSRNGFDMFMSLTRLASGPWTEAERRLGAFYLASGRSQSVVYLAAAVNEDLCLAMDRLKRRDSSFEYRGLSDLAARILADRELKAWAGGAELWGALHELGLALDRNGSRESAREIWSVLAAQKGVEPWNGAAARALRDASGK